jgi:hypothetical protein
MDASPKSEQYVVNTNINPKTPQSRVASVNPDSPSSKDPICSACRQIIPSIHSSSTHSLSGTTASNTRRDSGYSSKRQTTSIRSRSSSKHSVPSTKDIVSSGDESSPVSPLSTQPPPLPYQTLRPRSVRGSSKLPAAVTTYHQQHEAALALHERSIALFPPTQPRSGSLTRSLTTPLPEPQPAAVSSMRPTSASVRQARGTRVSRVSTISGALPSSQRHQRPVLTRARSALEPTETLQPDNVDHGDGTFLPVTIMHWTSDETRRREYDAIDRESRGIRGFWNKIRPRMFRSKSAVQRGFYDPEKHGSDNTDAGSVRRYRLRLEGEG